MNEASDGRKPLPSIRDLMEKHMIPLPESHLLYPRQEDAVDVKQPETKDRSEKYEMTDDLQILKTVYKYFGPDTTKVPWSFWSTFRKLTGSTRSSSSLYHHWNGSMKRKYGAFIDFGNIEGCIKWLEMNINPVPEPGRCQRNPLCHNFSQDDARMIYPKAGPSIFVRTNSTE